MRHAIKVTDPKKRGNMILKIANNIRRCNLEDEEEDRGQSISTEKKHTSHRGCGAEQPKFTKKGLKIEAKFLNRENE